MKVKSLNPNKIYRRISREFSLIQSTLSHYSEVIKYSNNLPILTPSDISICKALLDEGVFRSSLTTLSLSHTKQFLDDARSLMSKIPVTPSESQYVIHADSAQILSHPNIFLWGLEERLLNIVESYLGVPVAYRGVFFQRDLANGQNVSTRLWHKDPEDYRIVKILVYLNDVNENGGPFEYIPRYLNPQPFRLRYQLFFSDSEMARLVPKSEWVSCTGTAETVIFFDPHNIFHRGKLPTGSDRFAIFFAYHSRKPIKVFRGHWKAPFSHDELLVLSRTLSQRQRECVFWWEHEDQSFKPDLMRDH